MYQPTVLVVILTYSSFCSILSADELSGFVHSLIAIEASNKLNNKIKTMPLVLSHFWRNQAGVSVRNGSIGVTLLDRNILCRVCLCWSCKAAQSNSNLQKWCYLHELEYSPLPLLDGGEFISEVDCRDCMGWLSVHNTQERLLILRRECA